MNLLQGPNPSQLKAISLQVGEDPDKMQHNIKLLQKWIACQPHLPQDYDNNMLSVFLRGCKHNLERTKKKIEMYFIARTKVPELFGDREITKELMDKYTKMMKLTTLRKLTPDGYRVTIFKITCVDGSIWDTRDVLRYIFMVADLRVAEETPIAGDIFVYDVKNLKGAHLIKYVTPILRKALAAAHEAYPQRLQQLHFINSPPVLEKFLSVTKTFLKEKMRNRFLVHENIQSLLKYLPEDILPEEYGGTSGKFDDLVDEWTNYLIIHNKWFQQQDNVKAFGPIPEHVFYNQFDDIIGVEGSFRKLNID